MFVDLRRPAIVVEFVVTKGGHEALRVDADSVIDVMAVAVADHPGDPEAAKAALRTVLARLPRRNG